MDNTHLDKIRLFLLYSEIQLPQDLYSVICTIYKRLIAKEIKQEIDLLMKNGNEYFFMSKYMSEQTQKYMIKFMMKYMVLDNQETINMNLHDMQKLAIQKGIFGLSYIHNPSEEIQRLAVEQQEHAISFISNPSEEVQKLAIRKNVSIIQYILNLSEEMQKFAIQQDRTAICYIHNPTEEVQKMAKRYFGLQVY